MLNKTWLEKLLLGLLLTPLTVSPVQAHEHVHDAMQGHWMAPAKEAKRQNPVKASPESVARGVALFQTHCAACHGATGLGDGPAALNMNPKPQNLKEMSNHHSDGVLAWKIANGRGGPMPSWKKTLKQKQIWDLVNYIRSLSAVM